MKWISVKDELPDKEDDYLTCIFEKENTAGFFKTSEVYRIEISPFFIKEIKKLFNVDGYISVKKEIANPRFERRVTHWMPLPEPPEE